MTTRRAITLLAALSGAAAMLTTQGCDYAGQHFVRSPGGNMFSDDTYTYMSSPYEPLTVTLYDTRDNEPLWTVDVPIGSKVSLRFRENKVKDGSPKRPDIMDWVIYDAEKRWARMDNRMAVPPADSRLLRVALRDPVEYPPAEIEDKTFPDPQQRWTPVEPKTYRDDANASAEPSYYTPDN